MVVSGNQNNCFLQTTIHTKCVFYTIGCNVEKIRNKSCNLFFLGLQVIIKATTCCAVVALNWVRAKWSENWFFVCLIFNSNHDLIAFSIKRQLRQLHQLLILISHCTITNLMKLYSYSCKNADILCWTLAFFTFWSFKFSVSWSFLLLLFMELCLYIQRLFP